MIFLSIGFQFVYCCTPRTIVHHTEGAVLM